jgi:hypothetical protein
MSSSLKMRNPTETNDSFQCLLSIIIYATADSIFIEDKFESPLGLDSMTIDDAIEVIQKNERGRQGVERAAVYRSNR